MTRTTIIFALTFLYLFSACDKSTRQNGAKNSDQQIDTLKAIKIGDYWATPKPTFEYNMLLAYLGDTLSIVTCAEYVYSPFGRLNNKSEIKNSNLKNFNISERVDKIDFDEAVFQILTLEKSRLMLTFDNDPEASKHSYIFEGEINDSNINFIDDIKIGMSKEKFIKIFFDNFPNELMTKYKFIVFESCVQDIKHTYTFKADKLQSVNFKTDRWTQRK